MMREIKKVAVIGAGVMGASIAAHVANAGVAGGAAGHRCEGCPDRSAIAEGAVEKMLKTDPAPFMSRSAAKLVTPGNHGGRSGAPGRCDWIIEAVIERLDIKQALYAKMEAVRKAGSVVSSNTSTIPLANLIDGLPDALR